MPKKKSAVAPVPKGNRSDIWADEFAGTGKQHTMYAPELFFDLWVTRDPKLTGKLKAHVNEFLLAHVNDKPVTGVTKAPKVAPVVTEVTDDDI